MDTDTSHPNIDLPHRKLSKKPKSSMTEVAPIYIPNPHKKSVKYHASRESMNNEDMARKHTTLGSEPEVRDIKQLHRTTFMWPKHSNQAYANAKNFYKKFIDTETKTKRLKLFHNIQKKKTETTPEFEQKTKERDMNRLIETNLRLFRNMNNIFGSYANPNSSKFLNDSSSFLTQGEQSRQKEYRSVSNNTKKYDSKIVGYGRSQIFIPVETNFGGGGDEDSKLNFSDSVYGENFFSRKRVSTTINNSERREMQTTPSPNKSRRVSSGTVKRGNKEKKNLSVDYYLNKKENKIGIIDLAPIFGPETMNHTAVTVNNIIYEKPVYKIPDTVNQALANLIHESSSVNKNTLNLMTKLVRDQAQKEEVRNRWSSRGTPQKYKQREFWVLNEKSKRSSSVAI